MFENKKNIVEGYKGNEAKARTLFLKDKEKKQKNGYYPVSENWAPGSYGSASFFTTLVITIALFFLVGPPALVLFLLVVVYMLITKPAGTLTATYEYRETSNASSSKEEKNTSYDFIKAKGKFLSYDSSSGVGIIMTDSGKKLDFNVAMWDDPEALPEVGLDSLNIYNKQGKLSIMTKGYELESYEKLAAEKNSKDI